ncbi:unnamed protein product [Schistocephalus solidus]|uniref:Prolyl endopeptidase n=1 Tax=Schistocephalus solidus TaxID=70667 RepID=A0A183SND1_SCHSO|nr:unnamed protein product [Schistocephalus solidus]
MYIRFKSEPHIGYDEAVIRPTIGIADCLGHQHVLLISPLDENIFQQLPAPQLWVHPRGLLPRLKAEEDVDQQDTVFHTGSQKKEAVIVTATETLGTQPFRPGIVVCPDEGFEVHDPYRWLEDPNSEETKAFVDAQNALTMPFINSCPVKKDIHASVLYVMDQLGGPARVFFDPNTLDAEGLTALTTYEFSEDGELFAYGLSHAGSDWVVIKVKNVATGEDLSDKLERVKFSGISWTHDNKGFFYACFPDAASTADGTETTANENHKLKYHRIGDPQSADVLCAERPDEPKWMVSAEISDCGRYVLLYISAGCERNNLLYYADLEKIGYNISGTHFPSWTNISLLNETCKLNWTPIMDKFEAVFTYVTNEANKFVIYTDLDAPMFKVITVDLNNLSRENWKDLIPHDESVLLERVFCVNQKDLVICRMKDVTNRLSIHDLETGAKTKDIPIDIGSVSSMSGRKKDTMMFFQFTSFLEPGVCFSYDLTAGTATKKVVFKNEVKGLDLSNFEVRQLMYESKDATRVPMFIMRRKNLPLDGSAPCLLYGYGGFAISLKPFFSVTYSVFLQHFNGVAAVANIRGGGEYGEKWHSGGKLFNKQNSFDDFIAAAESLIELKYTSPERLIIEGGSNGGLLVCACSNQRPDLFAASICHVPVTDMLRFHRFTIGHAWQSDYGDVSKEEVFRYLMRYSPLHTIPHLQGTGVQYPATLVLTADHDDRVVPLHSLKYIATLQETVGRVCTQQKKPLLVRVETKAGHGAGKPTSKRVSQFEPP